MSVNNRMNLTVLRRDAECDVVSCVQRMSSDCDVMHYDVIWILLCHATVHDTVVAGKVLHNSPVYNVICHCQGAYGACTNGSFGKRKSFRGVLLKYTIFNQSPMKWPSFP